MVAGCRIAGFGFLFVAGFFPGPISFQRMRMWHDAVETIVDFPQS